jgi:hypothetical protein
LEVCQALGRNFLGCDLTFKELAEFNKERKKLEKYQQKG